MNYIKELSAYRGTKQSVVSLGKFDGVHEGHRLLMEDVLRAGREDDLETIIFTFDVPPQSRLDHMRQGSIMTNRERARILEEMGIETLIECPFTKEIQMMEASVFVEHVLLETLHASLVVVGADFRFGRGRAGDAAFLQELARSLPFSVRVIGKKQDPAAGRDISSTWIRDEIRAGRMESANRLLGTPYFLLGEIVHGRQLGRTIQVPTINQIPAPEKLLPPYGVYFSRTTIGDAVWNSITNIGTKPTVSGEQVTAETHLLDAEGDLYGQEARVELLKYHRPEQRFASVDALRIQMEADIQAARDFLTVKL